MKRKKNSKRAYTKFKTFVEDTVNEIQQANGLTDYETHYEYSEKIQNAPHNKVTLATIDVDRKYLTATICIYRPLFDHYKHGNYRTIREVLAHEIAHIRTIPLERLANDRWSCPEDIEHHAENITELMGRMMYKLLYVKPKIKYKK